MGEVGAAERPGQGPVGVGDRCGEAEVAHDPRAVADEARECVGRGLLPHYCPEAPLADEVLRTAVQAETSDAVVMVEIGEAILEL